MSDVNASPLAKKLAVEAGIELGSVSGTGSNGKIVKSDVEKMLSVMEVELEKVTSSKSSNKVNLPAEAQFEDVKLSKVEEIRAKSLVDINKRVPHFTLTCDFNMEAIVKMRDELNKKAESMGLNYRLSVIDFIVKAVAITLRKSPDVNVSWREKFIRKFNTVDISLSSSIYDNDVTPVVKNADKRRLPDISKYIKYLSQKAKEDKLDKEESTGGNIMISDLGKFGIKEFSDFLTEPQAAVISIGAVEPRLIVKNEQIAVAKQMTCSLTVDARAIDKKAASEFMYKLREVVEEPLVLML